MDYEKLAALLFPDVTKTPDDFEAIYPPRNLPEGARVTRFAPSPTGYMHIGGLFQAITDCFVAHQTGGVAMLRIEDTDKKREVVNGVKAIVDGCTAFGVNFDEGATGEGTEQGAYGPYTQSQRVEIYHTVAKSLVQKGFAYPCFCSPEDIAEMKERQEAEGAQITGYFGKWAKCRALTYEEIEQNIKDGKSWMLRLRSLGKEDGRVSFDDMIKGKIELPENLRDEVLLKTDGVPTYHFAHACDDHFMRTTHVVRGEEWISSVPTHIALFRACGYKMPKYCHTAQVMKIDEEDGTKRKLSKRKDPEAAVSYFVENGFPKESVVEYLLTLLNSGFEDWRRANPKEDVNKYPFNLKKMSVSGCLFDLVKLTDISKGVISVMSADTVYERVTEWAKEFDTELYDLFTADADFAKAIINIDRENPKPRKDIAKWDEVKDFFSYFFDSLFVPCYDLPANISADDAKAILNAYLAVYDAADEKDVWFNKIKDLCEPLGFTPNVKEYKKNPDAFKGHVGDVSGVIRLAVTGRMNTPDLCTIMQLLGKEKVLARMTEFLNNI